LPYLRIKEDQVILYGTENSGLFYTEDTGKSWKQIATSQVVGNVDAIILSSLFPSVASILLMNSDAILLSRDLVKTLELWGGYFNFDQQLLSLAASKGIDSKESLLVGLANGDIRYV